MQVIRIPQTQKGQIEATVGRWHKRAGQKLAKGDVLVELELPGLRVELTASGGGTLRKVLLPEGTVAAVGAVLCLVGKPGESLAKALKELERAASAPAEVVTVAAAAQPVAARAKPAEAGASSAPAAPASGSSAPAAPPTSAKAGGTVVPVLMPQAGQSMEEGTVLAWRAKVGDRIKPGDIIFEVETDKANIEVEAVDTGRLSRIVVGEGQTVPVKSPVAYLAESDGDVDAYLASAGGAGSQAAQAAPAAPAAVQQAAARPGPVQAAISAGGHPKASPAARKVAQERGLDLAVVPTGSGPGGRIVSTDVLAAAGAAAPAPAAGTVRRKLSPMRKAIARNLSVSKQTIPHFYMRMTADALRLYAAYQQAKARFKCSVNDVVVLAVARTLGRFPAFRSRWDGDSLVEFEGANIGIAVGMENGLVVPVIVGADRMTLQELASRTRQVVEAARGGTIEGLGQGVMTITNLGMYGVEEFAAIINPPEASILAVGAIREQVQAVGGEPTVRKVLTMTLSADHRVVDGLLAAQFMAALKELIEAPEPLIE